MAKSDRSGLRGAVGRKVYCDPCGKNLYATRADAKIIIRDHYDKSMREYECDVLNGWHVGHIPHVIRRGEQSAKEIYG